MNGLSWLSLSIARAIYHPRVQVLSTPSHSSIKQENYLFSLHCSTSPGLICCDKPWQGQIAPPLVWLSLYIFSCAPARGQSRPHFFVQLWLGMLTHGDRESQALQTWGESWIPTGMCPKAVGSNTRGESICWSVTRLQWSGILYVCNESQRIRDLWRLLTMLGWFKCVRHIRFI